MVDGGEELPFKKVKHLRQNQTQIAICLDWLAGEKTGQRQNKRATVPATQKKRKKGTKLMTAKLSLIDWYLWCLEDSPSGDRSCQP